ncbi:MAG: glycosyltransferase [Bacteroidaceae bacterium]|nr:glycosyltransferase [Bacteroidaceae bacterium]
MKLISIIIATYNASKVIERCLESIIKQKCPEIELIIVDGNSKDNTIELIEKRKDDVDIIISEPDKGIYDAWNKGIQKASGQYIMFIGADDNLFDNVLIDYVQFIKEHDTHDVQIITAKSRYVDCNGKLIKIIGEPFSHKRHKLNMRIAHGTTLHNINLFKTYGLFDLQYKVCADYEFFMRIGEVKSLFFDKEIMNFQIGGASFSTKCLEETFSIRKRYRSIPTVINYIAFCKRYFTLHLKKIIYRTNE